ncbi:MAG: hypothetical protein NVS3B18_10480 [Candidatus Dormibacteria bacterium]
MGEKGTRAGLRYAWLRVYAPGFEMNPEDPDHAFNPNTGQNAHWDEEKERWVDSKTGEPMTASTQDPIK